MSIRDEHLPIIRFKRNKGYPVILTRDGRDEARSIQHRFENTDFKMLPSIGQECAGYKPQTRVPIPVRTIAILCEPRSIEESDRLVTGNSILFLHHDLLAMIPMIKIENVEPIDANYGGSSGTPIARHYIDGYMREIAPRLSGRILEFGLPTYSQFLNCDYEIIDIEAANEGANICADICNEGNCAPYFERYDHIICTAVLQLVEQPVLAVRNMHKMLKPGGSLVLAEKAMSRIDPWVPGVDRWRFTHHGLDVLMNIFQQRSIEPFGNVYAACAYLYGMPAEALDIDKLAFRDPNHVIVTIGHGTK